MARILIAAQNLIGAGAKVIGHSLVPALCRQLTSQTIRVLLPDTAGYQALNLDAVTQCRYFPEGTLGLRNNVSRLLQLYVTVPGEARRLDADVCLTLGDLGPASLPCRHVIFLHQPLLVYSEQELQRRESRGVAWKRRFMIAHFGRSARRAHRVLVQTDVMAQRVQQLYRIPAERIAIIPQPVPRVAESAEAPAALSSSPVECRLLFLAQYYAHKNHAILPAVCAELRRRGLGNRVRFFLTLNPADTGAVLERLLAECGGMGINLGVLSRAEVYASLRSASALFLPTLVESYGLIYLEAMSCGTPILTSDRDFARWICGDLPSYFDPLNAVSIADAIERFVGSGTSRLPEAAVEANLRRFPMEWSTVAGLIARHLL